MEMCKIYHAHTKTLTHVHHEITKIIDVNTHLQYHTLLHSNIQSVEEDNSWQVDQEEADVVVKKFVISQQTELHTSTIKKY